MSMTMADLVIRRNLALVQAIIVAIIFFVSIYSGSLPKGIRRKKKKRVPSLREARSVLLFRP
jgi:hypothetical protein